MAENSYNVNLQEKDDTAEYPSRPSSVNRVPTLHWFAYLGPELPDLDLYPRDREDRLRQVRERQNEERLRKLNEIKQQALQAQKMREQKEEERRKRIEEMRVRDQDRRAQVEERKRQIEDVERDRREYILRKNQEREARIESKRRNERCSSVFAFGSSTPRMLEPADTGGSSFWTNRRATSTTNVTFAGLQPFTRRSSEREIDGSKKRATSAGGLDREPSEDFRMSTSMYEVFHWHTPSSPSSGVKPVQDDNEMTSSTGNAQTPPVYNNRVARRRTDLMPTIPSPRDSSSLQHTKSFTRSPGRAYSMTRLDQLAQPRQPTRHHELDVVMEHRPVSMTRSYPNKKQINTVINNNNSVNMQKLSRSMSHLAGNKPLQKSDTSTSMSHLNISRPFVTPRMNKTERMRRQRLLNNNTDPSSTQTGVRSGDATPSRPGSAMSGTSSITSSVTMRRPTSAHTPPRRPRPASIAGTGLSSDYSKKNSTSNSDVSKPPIPHPRTKSIGKVERSLTPSSKSSLGLKGISSARSSAKTTPLQSPTTENVGLISSNSPNTPKRKGSKNEATLMNGDVKSTPKKQPPLSESVIAKAVTKSEPTDTKPSDELAVAQTTTIQQSGAVENLIEIENKDSNNLNLIDKDENKLESDVIEKDNNIASGSVCRQEQIKEDNIKENLLVDINESIPSVMSVSQPNPVTANLLDTNSSGQDSSTDAMSASMIAKIRITTEEEAKAALAERRRLAREELERQAELERQRLENEARLQAERERAEEEEQRRLEEETLRLAQQQREAEELRLRQAIEEAQRKEAEERMRRIEEEKQKAEKEEAERKAREEAEKQRIELAAKLEKEEKEREARRKRVEAIMLRTRGRGGSATANNSGNGGATGAIQTNNELVETSTDLDKTSKNNQSSRESEENILIRNGTTDANKQQPLKYTNDNSILREVQLQTTNDSIYQNRQLSIDNSSVVEQQVATNKVPLNGSNVVHIFEQHISSNANPGSVDVLDTINSNKSETQQSVLTTDLA